MEDDPNSAQETEGVCLGEIPLPEAFSPGEKRPIEENDESEAHATVNPNRSKTDFYCDVCESHMSTEIVWDSHIKGKRHLRNLAKKPDERPSRMRAVIRNDIPAQLQSRLDHIGEPIIGLDYMTEVQKSNQKTDPSYICYLCGSSMNVSNVIDHLLSLKHRVNCLKEEKPDSYSMMETMTLTKRAREALIEETAAQLENEKGRGLIEVKIEKSKLEDLPSLKKLKTDNPLVVGTYGSYSADSYDNRGFNIEQMNFSTKMQMLEELSTPNIKSDMECKQIMRCINKLSQCLIQYKVHNLPRAVQMNLTQQIISGNTDVLENSLSMTSSQQPYRYQSFSSTGGRNASYGMNSEGVVSYPMMGAFQRGIPNYMQDAENPIGNSYYSANMY